MKAVKRNIKPKGRRFLVGSERNRAIVWYQLWQLRLENTSRDRTTPNNDFAAISCRRETSPTKHATYEYA
jgi:hypothetical protein